MRGKLQTFRRRLLIALAGGGLGWAVLYFWRRRAQGMQRLSGDVRINGREARTGMTVNAGDSVQTGAGATAVFVIGADAFLMRADSHVQFSGNAAVIDGLRLLSGKLLGVFAPGAGRRITTPTATIGIRGTGAYLEAEPERTYFCLCYGSAQIASANGSMQAGYTTVHHESPRYIFNDGRPNTIVSARILNHSDDELIMLEALVGRAPPPGFMASYYPGTP